MASFFFTSATQLSKSYSSFRIKCTQKERVVPGFDNPKVFLREKVKELALRHEGVLREHQMKERVVHNNKNNVGIHHLDLTNTQFGGRVLGPDLLTMAYDQCRDQFVKENDHFNFGTSFLTLQKRKAIWAIWAWGRRVDELADGMNGSFATHETFDRMEDRVIDIYQGRPFDIYDVALADTLTQYPVDFQLFKDLIDGTRLDLTNRRFKTFDEVYLYRYYVASTFFLMLIQVMGFSPESTATVETLYDGIITLGIALTLIDSLRDIGEDAKVGRIYIPEDELNLAGVSERDIFSGIVTEQWRNLMKGQVKRARMLLDQGAKSINKLNKDVRWPLWATVLTYRQDLDVIEARDYDIFTKKPTSGKARRLATLPMAYAMSLGFDPIIYVYNKVNMIA